MIRRLQIISFNLFFSYRRQSWAVSVHATSQALHEERDFYHGCWKVLYGGPTDEKFLVTQNYLFLERQRFGIGISLA